MKKLLLVLSMLLLTGASAFSQAPYKVYTSPKLPARDALGRMNLVMAWNTRLKIDGRRDGIISVQVIPGSSGAQLVAQTYAGLVYLFDADSGDLVWKTQVGMPFWASQPAGYNSQSIFVARRNVLHVLNRVNGAQRVFTFDPRIKENTYGYDMEYAPSAGLVADEELLHVSMGDWLQSYDIPNFEAIERAKRLKNQPKAKDLKSGYTEEQLTLDSPQPILYWSHRLTPQTTEFPTLIHGDRLGILTTSGELERVNRSDQGPRQNLFSFKFGGRVANAAGQYHGTVYVGSDDYNLYAIDLDNGRLLWRYASGSPIQQKPEVNDRDIYIAPERVGLRLVDRLSGREVWTNRDSSRFLAANDRFVYAMDHVGKFFVLDALRGSTLAKYDLTDWAIPVPNEWTDRVFLAANDGQILCLRHRDLTRPMVMKSPEAVKKIEKKKLVEEKKEEMKDDEKKDVEKKDVEKKDDKKAADKKDVDKKDADKKDADKKDADKKDDKKDADKKDADKKDDKKDADKKDLEKMGRAPTQARPSPLVARRESAPRHAIELWALDDRHSWAIDSTR